MIKEIKRYQDKMYGHNITVRRYGSTIPCPGPTSIPVQPVTKGRSIRGPLCSSFEDRAVPSEFRWSKDTNTLLIAMYKQGKTFTQISNAIQGTTISMIMYKITQLREKGELDV